jgi:hypothetical protein
MPDVEVAYEHQVAAWTVGQLRAALEGIPDDYPVQVMVAETPGGDSAGEQVLFAVHQATVIGDGREIKRPELCLEADFASGTYVKAEWHD